MKRLSKNEINNIASEYSKLKRKADKNKKYIQKFQQYQKYAIDKLSFLIILKTNKYKYFSNYPDLKQEGFEGLLMALKTYNINKGNFSWWALKYISTKVCRAANNHSTIKIPIAKTKEFLPKKANMPILLDFLDPDVNYEEGEISSFVRNAVNELPEDQKTAISIMCEFNNHYSATIGNICKILKVSRKTCFEILDEAKFNLRNKLAEKPELIL